LLAGVCVVLVTGCAMVGPDYEAPEAPVGERWIGPEWEEGERDVDLSKWWDVFDDPVLDALIERAYGQNLPLELAGLRVIEAQARRGIAIGSLYPQRQEAVGAYMRQRLSEETANLAPGIDTGFDNFSVSALEAAWEIDLWGKFRRSIESADANLLGSVYAYDDVLVSLLAQVATNYLQVRIFEERLAVARSNRDAQSKSLEIAEARFEFGAVSERDVAQSRAQLRDTEALIPALEANLRQAQNALCVLLGIPPRDLSDLLAGEARIPSPRDEVLVGIPAELLRRRPDVRLAERNIAAQSAQIGVARADLFPSLQLVGSIGFAAEDAGKLFTGDAFTAFGGPNVRWNVLNYGQIRNNVRVQDAVFQELVVAYEDTVLRAQQEVEDAMAGFAAARRRVDLLADAAESARKAVELASLQYREGAVDYNTVLTTLLFQLQAEDRLVTTRGDVGLNLVALYRALGGGWERRLGDDFVDDETTREMRERTGWGGLLDARAQANDVEAAGEGTEGDRGWWRWRWWWPKF
jgi:NodT family efflux transporter outer membrane factor (OMF) lipoprotein